MTKSVISGLMSFGIWQNVGSHSQDIVDQGGKDTHDCNDDIADKFGWGSFLSHFYTLIGNSPKLKSEKSSKSNYEQHEQYDIWVDHIFLSFTIRYFHVVPVDVIWFWRRANLYAFAVKVQKSFVLGILFQEIVPEMLILEGNEGFSREMRKCERSWLIDGIFIANVQILLVEHFDWSWRCFK